MRVSLELVVVAVVLLIVAVVVIAMFTGGMNNFNSVFGEQSDNQIKFNLCAVTCTNYCSTHLSTDPAKPTTATFGAAGLPDPKYKGADVKCASVYGECKCTR